MKKSAQSAGAIMTIQYDAEATGRFLDAAFARHEEAHPGALIEIAYCWPGKDAITRARMFPNTAEGRREAAEFGCTVSTEQTNAYFAPSLRKADTDASRRAKKADVLGAAMVWLDFDDPGAAKAAQEQWRREGITPSQVVFTGTKPDLRAQAFWHLKEIETDQDRLNTLLAGAHVRFGFVADKKVINADRVMRLPGTLSWPKAGKDGRQLEVVALTELRGAAEEPFDAKAIDTLFPPRDPVAARRNEEAPVRGPDLLSAAPSPRAPVAPAMQEPEFNALGQRIDGRDEYAMQIIGGAVRNLAASLGRWPSAQEITADAWPTYSTKVAPKTVSSGEDLAAALEREGRGWSWFADKCDTHARRAQNGAIPGMETVEIASTKAAMRKEAQSAAWGPAPQDAVSARVADLLARAVRGPDMKPALDGSYLVKRWLDFDTLAVFYGAPGAAKTFLVLDLLRHVTSGEAWCGHRVRQAPALYIAGEGQRGILNRAAAMGGFGERFAYLPAVVDLCSTDLDARALVSVYREVAGDEPGAIVIDTLARAMAGGDENTAQDMGRLVRLAEEVRAATGCCVVLVHHSGKAGDMRGSSALDGAVDTKVRVERAEDDTRVAKIEKQKDGEEGLTVAFTLEPVAVGDDLDGEEVHSCIVRYTDAPKRRARLGPVQHRVLEGIRIVIDQEGTANAGGTGNPEPGARRFVSVDRAREFCRLREVDEDPKKVAKRVCQAFEHLARNGVICINDGNVWLI